MESNKTLAEQAHHKDVIIASPPFFMALWGYSITISGMAVLACPQPASAFDIAIRSSSSLVCCDCDHETHRACLYRQATCTCKI